jgi:hypothetical protein
MSTTKYKLADQALRILSGGDITNATDTQIREMMVAVSQARDFLVRQDVWNLIQGVDSFDIPGEYITTYEVEVKYDEKYDIMYSKLPAKYLNLPRNLGVYSVSLAKDMWNAFIPVSPNFRSLYRGLGASGLEDRIGYWISDRKVYFQGMDQSDNIGNVSMRLIVASNEIDDEDEVFPIPADKELEVVKLAIDLYAPQKAAPSDEINNTIEE